MCWFDELAEKYLKEKNAGSFGLPTHLSIQKKMSALWRGYKKKNGGSAKHSNS